MIVRSDRPTPPPVKKVTDIPCGRVFSWGSHGVHCIRINADIFWNIQGASVVYLGNMMHSPLENYKEWPNAEVVLKEG